MLMPSGTNQTTNPSDQQHKKSDDASMVEHLVENKNEKNVD